jgi:hypothetical protein
MINMIGAQNVSEELVAKMLTLEDNAVSLDVKVALLKVRVINVVVN